MCVHDIVFHMPAICDGGGCMSRGCVNDSVVRSLEKVGIDFRALMNLHLHFEGVKLFFDLLR